MGKIIGRVVILLLLADIVSARDDSVIMAGAVLAASPPILLGKGCYSPDLTGFGRRAVFDGTIMIEGGPPFVGRTVEALNRVRHLPEFRYAKALNRIVERDRGPFGAGAWIYRGTRTANVRTRTSLLGCSLYGSVILHEGVHATGEGEWGAYRVQARALRAMGLPAQAFITDFQALVM